MRKAFINSLVQLATGDPRILLLTGDLGYTVLEPFIDKFPDRFFNVGVAEQNMVGVATGLAEAGYIPFCYSIVTFAGLRPYEFIRNGPILHQLPVRIVGVGGGFEYGHAGATHHGLEDIGVMRVQPGITVMAPADHQQASEVFQQTWDLPGPVYYRLSKDDHLTVPGLEGRFELGQVQVVREGAGLILVAMGSIASDVVKTADRLADLGIAATVAIVASVTPAPIDGLATLLAKFSRVVTVEAHYCVGGVGSLVSEVVAERGLGCRVVRCGVRTTPEGLSGGQSYLHQIHGLSPEGLVETVRAMFSEV